MRSKAPEPLVALCRHAACGSVPLAWVAEHAPDGDLQRLWDAASSAALEGLMILLCRYDQARGGPVPWCRRRRAAHKAAMRVYASRRGALGADAEVADAYRRVVPRAPTLQDLLDAGRVAPVGA